MILIDSTILTLAIAIISFCVGYPLLTTSFQVTAAYRGSVINIGLFGLAVAVLSSSELAYFSQSRYAQIQDINTVVDGFQTGIKSFMVLSFKLSLFMTGVAIVSFLLASFFGGMLELSEDSIGILGTLSMVIIYLIGLVRVYGHLQTATTNPQAHLHLLMILSLVPTLIVPFSLTGYQVLFPEESDL